MSMHVLLLLSLRRACTALLVWSITIAVAQQFNASTLLKEYELVSGRTSACPGSVAYTVLDDGNRFMKVSTMSADRANCTGVGGKRIEEGAVLRRQGLRLPQFTSVQNLSFYAGVESAPRVCGKWAFNASVISWYVYNGGSDPVVDSELGLELEPGYVYLTYEHFSDICIYRANANDDLDVSATSPSPSTTKSPGAEPTREAGEDSGSVCFPARATVELADGRLVTMDQLKIGDAVRSSTDGSFSDVYMFSHNDGHVAAVFVRIETRSGSHIELTPGHYIYLDGRPKMARLARVGDVLHLSNGSTTDIISVRRIQASGLFNPHTLHGDIIVNGLLVTSWTTAVAAPVAAVMLAPLRFPYMVMPQVVSHPFSNWIPNLIDFLRRVRDETSSVGDFFSSSQCF